MLEHSIVPKTIGLIEQKYYLKEESDPWSEREKNKRDLRLKIKIKIKIKGY